VKELIDGDIVQSVVKDIDVGKFQERQSLPALYHTTGAVYTNKRPLLKEWSGKDSCFGKEIRAVILDAIQTTNIDEEADVILAEFLSSQE